MLFLLSAWLEILTEIRRFAIANGVSVGDATVVGEARLVVDAGDAAVEVGAAHIAGGPEWNPFGQVFQWGVTFPAGQFHSKESNKKTWTVSTPRDISWRYG
jgi:hypothetical protein